ncbi:MAG: class I SAM-dependent RNA methyltransferase [Lachnospiraceae bacterium]|nr:class I SAM-dependent RNA methyltransferase [Lachnospiraceae bacterium]
MEKITMLSPCHFGLEAVLKKEIESLGLTVVKTEDGRVFYSGEMKDICRANIFLRTAERVLLVVGEFDADSFEALFDKTEDLPWEDYIPYDGNVWVTKANSIKSKLSATVPVQSVMKKAIAKRLCDHYGISALPETGADYPLRVTLIKDHVVVALDTTGEGLHKRGYRQLTTKAPIEETLAAALIMLTPWKYDRILVDPFCGSGTFAIEAALMGLDIAPGISREFTSEKWSNLINRRMWFHAREEAEKRKKDAQGRTLSIYASDIDPKVLSLAKKNAEFAGVLKHIHFSCADAAELKPKGEYGFIITNPPYGVRLEDIENAKRIYSGFAGRFNDLKTWSAYIITPIEETESLTGRKADKKRKVYNGMLKTDFYAFLGKKPGKDEIIKEAEKNMRPRPKAEKQKKQDETAIKEPASKHLTNISKRKFTTSK